MVDFKDAKGGDKFGQIEHNKWNSEKKAIEQKLIDAGFFIIHRNSSRHEFLVRYNPKEEA